MLSSLMGLVQAFERTHGFRPHLVCLNLRHLRQLLAEYPEVDQEKLLANLGFRILLLHEYDLPHPRVAWLPPIKPVVRRRVLDKSALQKAA